MYDIKESNELCCFWQPRLPTDVCWVTSGRQQTNKTLSERIHELQIKSVLLLLVLQECWLHLNAPALFVSLMPLHTASLEHSLQFQISSIMKLTPPLLVFNPPNTNMLRLFNYYL